MTAATGASTDASAGAGPSSGLGRSGNTMGLLTGLVTDAVRSDYGVPGEPVPDRGRRWVAAGLVVLMVAGLLLTVAAVRTRQTAPAAAAERAELVQRVERASAADAALDARILALREEVAAAQSAALSASGQGRDLADQVAALEARAGYTRLSGPGAAVVLRDAEGSRGDDPGDLGRVLDRDVQLVVNGLWSAGADGIAVNGQRLTGRTAIRSAGGAILVDYRPLRPPYRIEAVGDPAALLAESRSGTVGRTLQALADTYGLRWSADPLPAVTLPAGGSALPTMATVAAAAGGSP